MSEWVDLVELLLHFLRIRQLIAQTDRGNEGAGGGRVTHTIHRLWNAVELEKPVRDDDDMRVCGSTYIQQNS